MHKSDLFLWCFLLHMKQQVERIILMNGSLLMITFLRTKDPQGNQGTFVPMYRKPWGRKEGIKSNSFLVGKDVLLANAWNCTQKVDYKSSYLCVKVAEPSYSGYTVWKVFTAPTTRLNHSCDFPLSDGFIDSIIKRRLQFCRNHQGSD